LALCRFTSLRFPKKRCTTGTGKAWLHEFETLNEIAAAAELRPLRDFAENELDMDDDGLGSSESTYHPVSEGLPTVEGLVREIQAKPDVASKLSDPDYTLEELEELARSLRAAEARGARFRLFFL
jgi:hypothetical protein